MEDVLDLYAMPYDPRRPLVCFDEHLVQLIVQTRCPLPAKPGRPERYDYEYKRNGTRNLFLFFQPLAGFRHVRVTERRTRIDFAHCMKLLVDDLFQRHGAGRGRDENHGDGEYQDCRDVTHRFDPPQPSRS